MIQIHLVHSCRSTRSFSLHIQCRQFAKQQQSLDVLQLMSDKSSVAFSFNIYLMWHIRKWSVGCFVLRVEYKQFFLINEEKIAVFSLFNKIVCFSFFCAIYSTAKFGGKYFFFVVAVLLFVCLHAVLMYEQHITCDIQHRQINLMGMRAFAGALNINAVLPSHFILCYS